MYPFPVMKVNENECYEDEKLFNAPKAEERNGCAESFSRTWCAVKKQNFNGIRLMSELHLKSFQKFLTFLVV